MTASLLPVYRRSDLLITRGAGAYLYDEKGREYLDFAAGIAVNALGHGHPQVVAALKEQADRLWHCSNMYRNPGLERMADRLVAATFADRVFFCSTGAEAVECGIKMARRWHHVNGDAKRHRIITMQNGFHGRTLAGISAGGNDLAREGYRPLVDGFDAVPFNNLAAVEAAITTETAAILLEPVQGEGGIIPATPEFLHGVRALCDAHGLLLFFDEVQCGMGRTGKLFAYEYAGITPDIVAVAKGIGNGFPLAATLTTERVASCMTPGSHGSTYGGNPLAMAVGNAVLDVMLEKGFFDHVTQMGALLKKELEALAAEFPHLIKDVRGVGLLLGLEMQVPHYAFVEKLRAAGFLTAPAYHNVIRLTPPLIIEEGHVTEAISILRGVCEGVPSPSGRGLG